MGVVAPQSSFRVIALVPRSRRIELKVSTTHQRASAPLCGSEARLQYSSCLNGGLPFSSDDMLTECGSAHTDVVIFVVLH